MRNLHVSTNLFPLREVHAAGEVLALDTPLDPPASYKETAKLRARAEALNRTYLEEYRGRLFSFQKLEHLPDGLRRMGSWRLEELSLGKERRSLLRGFIRFRFSQILPESLVEPFGISTEVVNWTGFERTGQRKTVLKVLRYFVDLVPVPRHGEHIAIDVGYRLMTTELDGAVGKDVVAAVPPRLLEATLKSISDGIATLFHYPSGETFRVSSDSVRRPFSLATGLAVDTRMDPPIRDRRIRDAAEALRDLVEPEPHPIVQTQVTKAGFRPPIVAEGLPLAFQVRVLKYVDAPENGVPWEVPALLRRHKRFWSPPRFSELVSIGHDGIFFRNVRKILNGATGTPGYVELVRNTSGTLHAQSVRLRSHTLDRYLDAIDDLGSNAFAVVQVDPKPDPGMTDWYADLKARLHRGRIRSQFMEIDRQRPGECAYGPYAAMNFGLQIHSKGEGVPYRVVAEKSRWRHPPSVVAVASKRVEDSKRLLWVCRWLSEERWKVESCGPYDPLQVEAILLDTVRELEGRSRSVVVAGGLSEYGVPAIGKLDRFVSYLDDVQIPFLCYGEGALRAFKGIRTKRGPYTPKDLAIWLASEPDYVGGYITPTGRPPPRSWVRHSPTTGTPIPVHVQVCNQRFRPEFPPLLELSLLLSSYHPNSLVNYSWPAPLHFAENMKLRAEAL